MEQEQWQLGTATADLIRSEGTVLVTLRGVITTMAYEALHLRLGRERGAVRLVIADAAIVVATVKSLAEAATRAAPGVKGRGPAITLLVSRWRLEWATHHCLFAAVDGLALLSSAEPLSSP